MPPSVSPLSIAEPIESISNQYGLDCTIKDIDTDISKEKKELRVAYSEVEGKISQEINSQGNPSGLEDLVNEDCRNNKTLKSLSKKLVNKAEVCIVSSDLKKEKSKIEHELLKRICDSISSM